MSFAKAVAEELGISPHRLYAWRLLYGPKPPGLEQAKPAGRSSRSRSIRAVAKSDDAGGRIPNADIAMQTRAKLSQRVSCVHSALRSHVDASVRVGVEADPERACGETCERRREHHLFLAVTNPPWKSEVRRLRCRVGEN